VHLCERGDRRVHFCWGLVARCPWRRPLGGDGPALRCCLASPL
jgi:hypothetical protein